MLLNLRFDIRFDIGAPKLPAHSRPKPWYLTSSGLHLHRLAREAQQFASLICAQDLFLRFLFRQHFYTFLIENISSDNLEKYAKLSDFNANIKIK
jgi:hypothetical protein